MARQCIFGCERAGSGEHVFPATLGGRRVNKGILCDKHNNALAPLAGVLSEQLRTLNALIGVRPDHNKFNPHEMVLTGSDGQEYALSVNSFQVKGAHVLSEKPLGDGRIAVTMEFGTQEEVDRWIKAQEEAGNKLESISQDTGTRLSHDRFRGQVKLGGSEGLRAVGYVALTFLAHRYPDLASSPTLEPFRNYVLTEGRANDYIWWLAPPSASVNDPYPLGHKIEIAVPTVGDAHACVTFFSSVAFGINFGPVTNTKAETVTTFVDPLALHPPDDVREYRTQGADIGLQRPASQTATLRDATTSGSAERAFSAFMERVTDYRLQEDMRPLFVRLEAAKAMDARKRRVEVDRIVTENSQRILNLIRYVADDLRRKLDVTRPSDRIVLTYINAIFPEGKEPSKEFEIANHNIQAAARAAVAQIIDKEVVEGPLDLDRLSMLLGGGPGAAIVDEVMLSHLRSEIA